MNNSLTTAAFMTIGLQRPATPASFNAVLDRWGNGMVELVDELVKHAPYADALMDAGYEVKGEVPGVAAYEIAEEFGAWFSGQIMVIEAGSVPGEDCCRNKLRELARAFYNADEQLATTLQAVELVKYFEITGVGFEACSDATDDRVLWVSAASREILDDVLQGVEHQGIVELDPAMKIGPECIDHTLPNDANMLRAALARFSKGPTISELEVKLKRAHAALRIAHGALFNDSGDGDVHMNAVRAIDAALSDTTN